MNSTPPGHGHLWTLDDGTPVHAPPGRLIRNDQGQVCCHLCGRWFDHLGAHLRRHGWTAAQYRTAVGLAASRALCNVELSTSISDRQTRQWAADETVRVAFDTGRQAGVRALTAEGRDRTPAPETAAVAAANLRQSRTLRDVERADQLRHLAHAEGHDDVDAFLRHRYEHGASLQQLQKLTGWSRPRVRAHLEATGANIRAPGETTPAGRANRTRILAARVTERIGTADIDGWLREQRTEGATYTELARQTGRSDTWVRHRLKAPEATSRHQNTG